MRMAIPTTLLPVPAFQQLVMIIILLQPLASHYLLVTVEGNSSSSSSSSFSSKAYPLGCSKQSSSYYDYDNYNPSLLQSSSYNNDKSSNHHNHNKELFLKQYHHDNFIIMKRLGSGKFSDVFEAIMTKDDNDIDTSSDSSSSSSSSSSEDYCFEEEQEREVNSNSNRDDMVAIKCLKPVSIRKVKRELLILSHVSSLPNLTRLRGILCFPEHNNSNNKEEELQQPEDDNDDPGITTLSSLLLKHPKHNNKNNNILPALVLEHAGIHSHWFSHGGGSTTTSSTIGQQQPQLPDNSEYLSMNEIKYYLYNLLIALDALHSIGIMHRDVKPRNILITRASSKTKKRSLVLVDLGLADFYLPHKNYNVRVASRHYKSPELLINYPYYDYSLDMWSVGCILASLLLRKKEPIFKGKDNLEQLYTIISILGTDDFLFYCDEIMNENRKFVEDQTQLLESGDTNSQYDEYHPPVYYELDPDIYHTIIYKKHYELLLLPNKRKSWMTFLQQQDQQLSETTTTTTTTTTTRNDEEKSEDHFDTNKKKRKRKKHSTTNTNHNKKNNNYSQRALKEGFDLLDKLLIYDHRSRYTAREALLHSFFDDVRDDIQKELSLHYDHLSCGSSSNLNINTKKNRKSNSRSNKY